VQDHKTRPVVVPDPSLPARRGAASVLFTLVGFVAGCVAMFGSLSLLHAEAVQPGKADQGSPSTAPSMDDTAALLEHIPPAIRPSCTQGNLRSAATQDSIYASVVCQQQIQGVPVQVQYMSVHDAIALRGLFDTQVDQNGIQRALSGADETCDRTPPLGGAFRWYGGTDEMTGEVVHAFSPVSTGPPTQGRVACYLADSVAWLDWIDFDTHIYAFASTSIEHYEALFSWWRDQAGPYHPRHQVMPGSNTPSAEGSPASPQM
jgi:hypothetical protein